ncbi:PspA/IM30 family protein [Pseudoalteromonas xiamenensis]
MALIERIENVIKAELNALLDKAEDPKKLASVTLNDLQECLAECRATAAGLICEQKAILRHREQSEKQNRTVARKSRTCVNERPR